MNARVQVLSHDSLLFFNAAEEERSSLLVCSSNVPSPNNCPRRLHAPTREFCVQKRKIALSKGIERIGFGNVKRET